MKNFGPEVWANHHKARPIKSKTTQNKLFLAYFRARLLPQSHLFQSSGPYRVQFYQRQCTFATSDYTPYHQGTSTSAESCITFRHPPHLSLSRNTPKTHRYSHYEDTSYQFQLVQKPFPNIS
ncbi:hypothetical protein Hanom_Chr00s000142g01625821 [Helianthus anomalus]